VSTATEETPAVVAEGFTTSGWTVTEVHRDSNALYGAGWYAMAQHADGLTMHVSQLDGESYWVADGLFGRNGFPHWCHGFGSRCTMLRTVQDVELVAMIEAMVREAS
jgi:hypothetical protein